MLTGPTIWSYLEQINSTLRKNPQPHEEDGPLEFWTRSVNITGDAILVYRCYLHALDRFETINRGKETRVAIKDIEKVEPSLNKVRLFCKDEKSGVQIITFRAGEYAEDQFNNDWGMDCGPMNTLNILSLPEPENTDVATLFTQLFEEVDKAILFFAEAPGHWQEDMASSGRLGVWQKFHEQQKGR